MTTKKAKLVIVLKADDAIVAEVENPDLWRDVLAAVHSDSPTLQNVNRTTTPTFSEHTHSQTSPEGSIAHFAKILGVSEDILIGALDPSTDAPYLHLDIHCWEEMKKHTPLRGPGAISPAALAGTLLALWFRETNLGHPTQGQALDVLDKSIGIQDKNASRGIKKTKWLQGRQGGVILLNPAQISKATAIANSFCTKKWSHNETTKTHGTE